ncbi:MAG: hypothetical protein II605_03875 [Paludibacteraceae bacterium]|nr:hypothetical protein [Paludibacteraceae bacterium]MBQ4018361.1 hypothetical protein [Paludibacteraceae bacterium]MBQ5378605.1 hypothetical protein [Paludibacteraceae bacterium]
MKKIVLMIAVMAMMSVRVCYADGPAKVPAYRGIIERVQPNGDTLRTYLRGDEHRHWMMTEDGWQIKESKKGWLKYVKMNRKGQVVLSCRKAHNADQRRKCEQRWLEKHGVKKEL